MYVLRCTQRLLGRLGAGVDPDGMEPEPTTILGDWYANPLNIGRLRLVLCTSEKSLLCALVPARGPAGLADRLRGAVGRLLPRLGIDHSDVQRELREMAWHQVGRTCSRRVLGSMNDFAFLADGYIRDDGAGLGMAAAGDVDLDEIALTLARAPCSPISYQSPERFTQALFQGTS